MSRLTAAQVIALGEYLDADFDPSTLTVAQLLGVFGYHNVNYPSQYTKPKLVQLFKDEIKVNANKLRRQRIKKENSQASDDGITDGLTGLPINEGKKASDLHLFTGSWANAKIRTARYEKIFTTFITSTSATD
ncbi:hypothetical protein EVJ58_g6171 [Rhodofomes roseus]|uniref:HeH/LEM domain-containing protein n=1 Tax=Rhodofomes roseus TaxID=34475 RepID=A0A4Y9YAS1_9APHY|nr:hypothetical protein EVJ58_g6171 [Rhodofomes roseus]